MKIHYEAFSFIIVILCALSVPVCGENITIKEIDQILPDGFVAQLHIDHTSLYVSDYSLRTVRIVDIKNPSNPEILGTYHSYGGEIPHDIAFDQTGLFMYVAEGHYGFKVVDVSNAFTPVQRGTHIDGGLALSVATVDNLVYLADWDDGLEIIDLSNPLIPSEVAQLHEYANATDVLIYEDRAFITHESNGSGRITILDISDPLSPIELTTINQSSVVDHLTTLEASLADIYVNGNHLFLAFRNNGLLLMDLSDLTNPTVLGTYYDGGNATWGLDVNSDRVFLADWESGIKIIDISEPSNPNKIAEYYDGGGSGLSGWGGYASDILQYEDIVFVSELDEGVEILDLNPDEDSNPLPILNFDIVILGLLPIIVIYMFRRRHRMRFLAT
ncbi:MAG: LVIVD repeat-containing protein [Candidatus Kariarchaeaceae archaeon]|jgi:hypothetical protein